MLLKNVTYFLLFLTAVTRLMQRERTVMSPYKFTRAGRLFPEGSRQPVRSCTRQLSPWFPMGLRGGSYDDQIHFLQLADVLQ